MQTILVVEDERPLQEAIKNKLTVVGFEVVTASTIEQSINYLKDLEKVDAIWLDHYLFGKETGLDLVAVIKAEDSKWKDVPIFVVSNTASDEKIKSYMKLGVNKYFIKANVRLDEVVSEIKKAII